MPHRVTALHRKILRCRRCNNVASLPMPGYIGEKYFDSFFKILFVGRNPGQAKKYVDNYSTDHHTKEMPLEEFNLSYKEGLLRCNVGEYVQKIVEKLDMEFEHIAFLNIVKCTTCENSELTHEQIDKCQIYLSEQLQILRPMVIIALGTVPYIELNKKYPYVVKSYHPAYFSYSSINVPRYVDKLIETMRIYNIQRRLI